MPAGGQSAALLLTGARAPLTLALAVVGLSLVLVRSAAFPARYRLLLMLSGAAALPLVGALVLGLLPSDISAVRAFQVLTTSLGNLSGRQLLWPNFEQAAAGSPWLGWGVGAGNVIIPQGDPVVRLLQTWAAHNEYLRIEVEGGQLGRACWCCCCSCGCASTRAAAAGRIAPSCAWCSSLSPCMRSPTTC